MKSANPAINPPMALESSDLDLLEALPQPVVVFEASQKKIVAINSLMAGLTGYATSEPIGMDVRGMLDIHSSSTSGVIERRSSTDERIETFSCRILPKEGTAIPAELNLAPFNRGGATFVLATAHPKGRKKKSPGDGPVVQDEHYYRDLFENANDLIYTTDLDGRITSANRAILKAMGYTLDEALKLSIFSIAEISHVPPLRAKFEEILRSGKAALPYELLCRNREREKIWLEVSARLILSEGKPVSIQAIARDITARKKAEEFLRESKEFAEEQKNLLEWMIEQNPYAIALWNPDGGFYRCNEAFKKLVGMTPEPGYNVLRDRQVRQSPNHGDFQKAFRGETAHIDRSFYDVGKTPNRTYVSKGVWSRITLFPITGSDGRIIRVASFYQDITREVEGEEAREKLEKRLLESQKLEAIGTLAGGVAHDFNNLLTGVIGYLDLIRTLTGREIHPYLDKAELAAQRGSELTRQLLAYARKSRMERRIHDLNNSAQEVAALIRQTVDRRIEIRTRISPEPATVHADPAQMNQILMNLCLNARDALDERLDSLTASGLEVWQPRLAIEIKHHEVTTEYCQLHADARAGHCIRISVSDNGIGMDEQTKERIFEPFFTTKAVGKGTGLGLATLFGIVKQHDGWVDVHSTLGKGTTFHVYLPRIDALAPPLAQVSVGLKIPGGNESLLLVDDEEVIRELGKEILEGKGYRVRLAGDGKEALEILQAHKDDIDLVILDMTMPRLSGRNVLPLLFKMKPSLKIIATSGYSFSESWPDFQGMGTAAFLQKPYNAVDLARVVRRALDGQAL